jgi:hypothetical protein
VDYFFCLLDHAYTQATNFSNAKGPNFARRSNKCEWQVTLCNGGFYDGWKAFAMDHCLKKGEHLMFILIANDCFVVHIFDEFGFEKIIPRGLSSKGQR